MARLIRHDAVGPAVIDIHGTILEICQCGLSRNKPFCDGSHEKVRGEDHDKLYVYNEERERILLPDMFPQTHRKFTPADQG